MIELKNRISERRATPSEQASGEAAEARRSKFFEPRKETNNREK